MIFAKLGINKRINTRHLSYNSNNITNKDHKIKELDKQIEELEKKIKDIDIKINYKISKNGSNCNILLYVNSIFYGIKNKKINFTHITIFLMQCDYIR